MDLVGITGICPVLQQEIIPVLGAEGIRLCGTAPRSSENHSCEMSVLGEIYAVGYVSCTDHTWVGSEVLRGVRRALQVPLDVSGGSQAEVVARCCWQQQAGC